VSHKNVDEDPDLRRSSLPDTRRRRAWEWLTKFTFPFPGFETRFWYWPLWIVGLAFGLLLGWGCTHGWGSAQWGPLSGWFSGVLTATAVTVSLYQLVSTRKDTDRRQQEQFDQNTAHRQIDTIAPIWKAIGDADVPILLVANIMDEMRLIQREYTDYDPHTVDHMKVTERIDNARKRLHDQFKVAAAKVMEAELSFTNAMMIVEQPDVRAELSQLKDDYAAMSTIFSKILIKNNTDTPYDHSELDEAKSTVNKHRKTMVAAVREHLVRTPIKK